MFTLVIKGNTVQAQAALDAHKVKAFRLLPHPRFDQVIARVASDTPWATLAAWLCEGNNTFMHRAGGFETGALLWYGPYALETELSPNAFEAEASLPYPKGWDKVEGGPEGTSLEHTA